jgi:hypothetical protein
VGANPEAAGRGLESDVVTAIVTQGTEVEVARHPDPGKAGEENEKSAKQEEPEDHASTTRVQILHTASTIVTQT